MMGLLYDVETHTVNYHLKQIFADHELPDDSVIRNSRITAADGKSYDVSTYLDVAEDMALRQIPMTHAGLGKPLRRGWCLGSKNFRKELLAEMPDRTGPHHGGEERRATDEAWAEKLLAEALRRPGVFTHFQRQAPSPGSARKFRFWSRLQPERICCAC